MAASLTQEAMSAGARRWVAHPGFAAGPRVAGQIAAHMPTSLAAAGFDQRDRCG